MGWAVSGSAQLDPVARQQMKGYCCCTAAVLCSISQGIHQTNKQKNAKMVWQVFNNTMENCQAYGVKVMISPQGMICDNYITLPPGVSEEEVSASSPACLLGVDRSNKVERRTNMNVDALYN